MILLLIALFALSTVIIGRWMMGRWFNHLSLYSVIWGCALGIANSDLLYYHPISGTAWLYILLAWASLFLGSGIVLLHHHLWPKQAEPFMIRPDADRRLKRTIQILCFVGAFSLAKQIFAVIDVFGGLLGAILINGNDLYHARFDNPSLLGLSYLSACAPAACSLAGMYTALKGRLTLTALMPMALVSCAGILLMARAQIVLGLIWFLTAFVCTPRKSVVIKRWQSILSLAIAISFLMAGFSVVNANRGLMTDYQMSPQMSYIAEDYPVVLPMSFYFSGPVVGFSEYIKHPDPHFYSFPGMFTFAPVLRALGIPVPFYEENYYTPREINLMTWLKNIYSDFGPLGIILFPAFLSAVITGLYVRTDYSPWRIVLLSHLFVIVIFSFAENPMCLGVWYVSIVLGVASVFWVQKRPKPYRSWFTADLIKANAKII